MYSSRWVFVLLGLCFCSALALVLVRHYNRVMFTELQTLETRRDESDIEWGKLQLEYSMLANPARVEKLALERLKMSPPQDVVMINLGK